MADKDEEVQPAEAPAEEPTEAEAEELESTEDTEDVELEDIEVTDEEIGEDEEEPDEPAEEPEEPAESEGESDEQESEATEEESVEDSGEDVGSEDTTDKDRARQAFLEREARRQQAKAEEQQKYLDDADDDKDLALRQLQLNAYNQKVDSNRDKLQSGIRRAAADNPILTKGTSEQKEELARRLDDFERMYVVKDSNDDPIEIQGDVYEYLNQEAEAILRLAKAGAREGKRAKSNTKARTLTPPSRKPKESKVDQDVADFDEEIGRAG